MRRLKKVALSGIIVFFLVIGVSCSMIPQGIQNLFATKTPTPTNTATSTPTPTLTPTPTKTPLPPLGLSGCVFLENCPQAVWVNDIADIPVNRDYLNTIKVPVNQPVQLLQDWTTVDQNLLDKSLPNIKWVFIVDGQDYFNPAWIEDGVVPDEDNPSIEYPGKWFGVVMSGWKLGETHQVKIGIIIKQTADDGWGVYGTGTEFITTYNFIPVSQPTATPTLTPTNTPLPTRTFTPRPTAVPYTKTPRPTVAPTNPPCSSDSSIEIDNTTGGIVTLKLSGPMKYRFDLATGLTTLNVCAGSYSYQAWGCGGATDSGTINSGEAHEFYCQ
jgi:hypothetical protein